MFGSGQWTIWEGYAASKLWKAGFRSNNLDPNARHCMASAVAGFMRTFGIDEPMGCYDDIEQADAFVLWGSNMAEMHPVLWSRITDRRLSQPAREGQRCCRPSNTAATTWPTRPSSSAPQTDLAILNYIAHYIISNKAVNADFVKKNVNFKKGADDIGYGLRPTHALEKDARFNGYPGADGKPKNNPNDATPITLRRVREVRQRLHGREGQPAVGRAREAARGAGQALRRPEGEGGVVLDDGLQPAHARHLGQQPDLQHPPADRQDQPAGQRPLLA